MKKSENAGANAPKEPKKAGCLSEFLMYLIAVVVGLGSIALVVLGVFAEKTPVAVAGIVLSFVFGVVVLCIPYLRRNSYIKWLAWAAIGDAAWWTYSLIAG